MKNLFIVLFILGLFSVNSFAQNDEMKKWMDYMTPGKEHESLAKMNGDWTYTSKMWMDPAAEPQTYSGTAKCEMVLGGRYQRMTVAGKIMGMDFSGESITAYDNGKKKYYSTWIDNFGTGVMLMEGTYNEATKTTTFSGKGYDPMSGGDMEMKQTIKYIDDNNYMMEMFNVVNGKEFKNMEMKYTRK